MAVPDTRSTRSPATLDCNVGREVATGHLAHHEVTHEKIERAIEFVDDLQRVFSRVGLGDPVAVALKDSTHEATKLFVIVDDQYRRRTARSFRRDEVRSFVDLVDPPSER